MQRVQEEFMREHAERQGWIWKRLQQSEELAKLLDDSVEKKREPASLDIWLHQAEMAGLVLGVKPAVWVNGLPERLEEVNGFADRLSQVDPQLHVIGDFAFHEGNMEAYLARHPAFVKELGWEHLPVSKIVEEVNEMIDRVGLANLTAEQHAAIGALLGFPPSSIKGFEQERHLVDSTGVPAPQDFFEKSHGKQASWPAFSQDDQAIVDALKMFRKREFERIQTLPQEQRCRAQGRLREISYDRLRPHLARWYQNYFGLPKEGAEHLASKRRVELYLKNAPMYLMDFAAYGEKEDEEERHLKQQLSEISSHL